MENKENYNPYMLQQRNERALRYLEDKGTPNDQIRRNLRKPLNTLRQPQVIKARTTTTTHNPNASDGAGPAPVGASKNYSHPATNIYSATSCMTSGHGNFDGSNLPSSNNSEEPLPLELHPTTSVPPQQQLLEPDMIPVVVPSQDTNGHTVSDDLCQQPLYNDSGGQLLQTALPSQLQMEVQTIASFNTTELSTNLYWQQSSPPESPSHPPILLTTPVVDPVQESCHGQTEVIELSSAYHAATVSSEEQFLISS